MMDDHGYVMLADFHWARFDMRYESKLRELQYHYMAPESLETDLNEEVVYTQTHDWWSFGMILYEMTFGVRPYVGDNYKGLY